MRLKKDINGLDAGCVFALLTITDLIAEKRKRCVKTLQDVTAKVTEFADRTSLRGRCSRRDEADRWVEQLVTG
jgi:hypothetical protein